VICKTSTNLVQSNFLPTSITRNQIEGELIMMIALLSCTLKYSFIVGFIQSIQYQDVHYQLRRKFDRESKRLNKGLSLLGKNHTLLNDVIIIFVLI
jgi:hypothetical protein